jgi:hypothetical protein
MWKQFPTDVYFPSVMDAKYIQAMSSCVLITTNENLTEKWIIQFSGFGENLF